VSDLSIPFTLLSVATVIAITLAIGIALVLILENLPPLDGSDE
jgi:hypothetical protein